MYAGMFGARRIERVAPGAPLRAQRKGPTGGWVERAREGAPGDRTRSLGLATRSHMQRIGTHRLGEHNHG